MQLISNHIESLKNLCAMHSVDKLYIFGSVLGKNFTATSDIDLMVKFKPIDLDAYFDNYTNLKEKLKMLLGRDVDLLEEQTLKNPILIKAINRNKELVYG